MHKSKETVFGGNRNGESNMDLYFSNEEKILYFTDDLVPIETVYSGFYSYILTKNKFY